MVYGNGESASSCTGTQRQPAEFFKLTPSFTQQWLSPCHDKTDCTKSTEIPYYKRGSDMLHGQGMVILRREFSFLNAEVLLVEGKDGLALKNEHSMECSEIRERCFLSSEHKETKVRKCRESGSNKQFRLPGVRRQERSAPRCVPRCVDQICGRSWHKLRMLICGKCLQPSWAVRRS